MCKQMRFGSFKNVIYKLCVYKSYTPLDKNIRPPSKMMKKILFTILKI